MQTQTAPWHKRSFDTFIHEKMPALLESRMPLASISIEDKDTYSFQLKFSLVGDTGEVTLNFPSLPQPNEQGIFKLTDTSWIVMPFADSSDLPTAHIKCVGEQLYDFIAARLGEAPEDLPLDEDLARAWLPFDEWSHEFLTSERGEEAHWILKPNQSLKSTNWLSIHTHLRRLVLPRRTEVVLPKNWDGVCPINTPEGPNLGRILYVALGAEIRDGKLVVLDDAPKKAIGLAAAMVPFLEHNQTTRSLLGSNIIRQWGPLSEPEPALVQTGHEPNEDAFWQGVNLLTAFMSWDMGTHEHGLVVSTSCAHRLRNPGPLEPSDKITTRHGVRGVVTRILPDDSMPALQDGTTVDIIVSLMSLPSRMDMGALREAAVSRLAKAGGKPINAPPFHAPAQQEIQRLLKST
jgi:hypothetical protein